MIDTKTKRNLTEERAGQAAGHRLRPLPVKDAFTIVRGNGKRKLAVFEDPNCGYCKRFERDLQKIDNVTVHMFPVPHPRRRTPSTSRATLWCAKDKGKAWQDWMVRNEAAPKADAPAT
jgi:thiol:disulfide interchange protein DsbC